MTEQQTIDQHLSHHELHEFAQWFSFHYEHWRGEIGGKKYDNYPREDIIDIVDEYIKKTLGENGLPILSTSGFVKWFAVKYNIYGDCTGRKYQIFTEATNWDTSHHLAKTSQEWIDQHFEGGGVTNFLVYRYLKCKIDGRNIFELESFEDFEKQMTSQGIKIKRK
jgi:hypothetical protein